MGFSPRPVKAQVQDVQGDWIDMPTFVAGYIPPAGISIDVEFQPGPECLLPNPFDTLSCTLEYKIGTSWFMPVIMIPKASLDNLETKESSHDVTVSFSANSGVVVKYTHWLARPVFWLWQRWRAARRFVKGKLNARRTDD